MITSDFAIYAWHSKGGFLIYSLLPEATVVEAEIADDLDGVLARVPPKTKSFVFHLNCSMTYNFPRSRAALVDALQRRGITVLNERATDISKRSVQRICARSGLNTTLAGPDGDPEDLIIVKTNLNFGGNSESGMPPEERAFLGLGPGSDMMWWPDHYIVAPRKEIKQPWWTDENHICERFVSNPAERCYRAYLFLSRLVVCRLTNPHKIKKMDSSKIENIWKLSLEDGIVPEPDSVDYPRPLLRELTTFAGAFGLDFGTIDVMEDEDGQPYVVDVNTTPAYLHPVPGLVPYFQEILPGVKAP
jgi:hypothetical protein